MSSTRRRNLRRRLAAAAALAVGALTLAPSAAATGGQPGKQLPFRGYVQGFVAAQFAPGFPFVRSTFGGRCSVPSDWIAVWSGVGQSSQTGLIKAYGSDCDRVDLATGNLEYGDGVITEYGANGDYIYGTYTNGHGTLGGTISDDWTIIGGTGRFTGATGQGVETFELLVPPGSITFTSEPLPFINPWDGWISYDASQRRSG
jgi:hypothetical protein